MLISTTRAISYPADEAAHLLTVLIKDWSRSSVDCDFTTENPEDGWKAVLRETRKAGLSRRKLSLTCTSTDSVGTIRLRGSAYDDGCAASVADRLVRCLGSTVNISQQPWTADDAVVPAHPPGLSPHGCPEPAHGPVRAAAGSQSWEPQTSSVVDELVGRLGDGTAQSIELEETDGQGGMTCRRIGDIYLVLSATQHFITTRDIEVCKDALRSWAFPGEFPRARVVVWWPALYRGVRAPGLSIFIAR